VRLGNCKKCCRKTTPRKKEEQKSHAIRGKLNQL
jgi:hypothetical protein